MLDQAERGDELRTEAVVHVAHDALALFDDGALAFKLIHALVILLQFGVLLRNTPFQLDVELFIVVQVAHETVDEKAPDED